MKKSLTFLLLSFCCGAVATAQLIVDEGFDDLSAWTDSSGGNWAIGSNLSYAGWASTGTGSAFEGNASGSGTRLSNESILGSNVIADDSTYWGGILINATSAFTAPRNFGFGEAAGGPYRINIFIDASNNLVVGTRDSGADASNGGNFTGSSVSVGTGATNLLLFRIDARSGADDFYAWWNPDLSLGEPAIGTATFSSVGIDDFATTSRLDSFALDSSVSATVQFDELRLGVGFAEVTAVPEPSAFALVAGCLAFGWIAARRR